MTFHPWRYGITHLSEQKTSPVYIEGHLAGCIGRINFFFLMALISAVAIFGLFSLRLRLRRAKKWFGGLSSSPSPQYTNSS